MLKTFSGRRPSQDEQELRGLVQLFKDEGVRSYLEVGAREGDTFHEIVCSLPHGSRAVAVDLPGGYWGKSTTGGKLQKAADDLFMRGYDVVVILGDSTKDDVIERVRAVGPFDAALIDGDHRYEGVKADWLHYGPMARLVAFHDIAGDGQSEKVHGSRVEVPRLWAELKVGHQTAEFVSPGSAMGIGCVLR